MLALLFAGTASAQGLPAICEIYPNLPQCEEAIVVPPVEQPPEGPSVDEGTTGASAGSLPFTGYPLTPLILLLLVLLLVGLALRAYLAARDRLAADSGDGFPPYRS